MRLALASVLGVLALAGCGGNDTAAAPASPVGIVPAGATAYVEVDASLDSGQWRNVQSLLDRFPSRPQLLDKLNEQLQKKQLSWEDDVDPALGDVVAAVWLGSPKAIKDVVVLTQPDDAAKLQSLVVELERAEGETYVVSEVDGWTVIAEEQSAIDAFKSGSGSLADDDAFESALQQLPAERIALAWVRGEVLAKQAPQLKLGWLAAALEARDDGAAATIVTKLADAGAGKSYDSALVDRAPADALAFASFDGETLHEAASSLGGLEVLGLPLDDLFSEIQGEGAIWVRPALGVPEVTLVLDVDDAARARTAVAAILRKVPLEFHVGVVDGTLVATTASSPEAALRGGDTLGDSSDFREAAEVAGMPDMTAGFLYVNVGNIVPLLGLAGFAGVDISRELIENLRPIRSVVAWSEPSGDTSTQTVFVHIQ